MAEASEQFYFKNQPKNPVLEIKLSSGTLKILA
jgi:hypothetical protein